MNKLVGIVPMFDGAFYLILLHLPVTARLTLFFDVSQKGRRCYIIEISHLTLMRLVESA
jgi:hypothetical protein